MLSSEVPRKFCADQRKIKIHKPAENMRELKVSEKKKHKVNYTNKRKNRTKPKILVKKSDREAGNPWRSHSFFDENHKMACGQPYRWC